MEHAKKIEQNELLLKLLRILDESEDKSYQVYKIGFRFCQNTYSFSPIGDVIYYAKLTGLVRVFYDIDRIETIALTKDGEHYLRSKTPLEKTVLKIKMATRSLLT